MGSKGLRLSHLLSRCCGDVLAKAAKVELAPNRPEARPVALGQAERDFRGGDLSQRRSVYEALLGIAEDGRDLAVVVGTWPGSQRAQATCETSSTVAALRDRVLAVEPDLVVAEGDLMAATTLLTVLSHVYRDKAVRLCFVGRDDEEHGETIASCRDRHVFLVGGSKINRLAADLLCQKHDQLRYVPTDRGFEKTERAPEGSIAAFEVKFDEDRREAVDYSMFLKVKSEDDPPRFSFLFMGARQYATCGAVAALRDDTWLSCVMPKVRGVDEFQVIWQNRSGVFDPWPLGGHFVTDVLALHD